MTRYERPAVLKSTTHKMKLGCGTIYVSVNSDEDGKVIELFARLGKDGTCQHCLLSTVGRLVSIALQDGVTKEGIIRTMRGLACSESQPGVVGDENRILSCADGISKILEKS